MNSNDMMLFMEDCVQFFEDSLRRISKTPVQSGNTIEVELVTLQSIRDRMAALLDVVSEDSVTSSSEIEDNEEQDQEQQGQEHKAETTLSDNTTTTTSSSRAIVMTSTFGRNPNSSSMFVKKRKLVSLKANEGEGRQTRIAKKTRDTARLPKGALGTYTLLVSEIDELFTRMFK